METEILYSLATTDHIPLSMTLDLDSLPELSSYEAQEKKKKANAKFKYAVSFIQINEQMMRANSIAKNCRRDVYEFWKEVKVSNNSKMALPSCIDGISGDENIAELRGTHFRGIFNCGVSAEFEVGDVVNNDGVVIRPNEVYCAIEKLAANKECGPDKITSEHLKYASHRLSVARYVFLWTVASWHTT